MPLREKKCAIRGQGEKGFGVARLDVVLGTNVAPPAVCFHECECGHESAFASPSRGPAVDAEVDSLEPQAFTRVVFHRVLLRTGLCLLCKLEMEALLTIPCSRDSGSLLPTCADCRDHRVSRGASHHVRRVPGSGITQLP